MYVNVFGGMKVRSSGEPKNHQHLKMLSSFKQTRLKNLFLFVDVMKMGEKLSMDMSMSMIQILYHDHFHTEIVQYHCSKVPSAQFVIIFGCFLLL